MNNFVVCTIISKNYLAYARVLTNSLLKHHPNAKMYVLLTDKLDGCFDPQKEMFKYVAIAELGIPNLESFCFKYNIVELNTAVKPYFLRYLFLKTGAKKIIFLDPDILITNPLNELSEILDKNSIILTPHITQPINDSWEPTEKTFLLSGTYNLGFIGLRKSETSKKFLDWWAERLYDSCLNRTEEGLFVDQKPIDLVPGFFEDTYILREPNYNVAYWNLQEREISLKNGTYLVNGKPLIFYHFSGFIPEYPRQISKFQNRFALKDFTCLPKLIYEYKTLLYEHGYKTSKRWPYAFGHFDNGTKITEEMRRIYYSNHHKKKFGNPFDTQDENSFFHWFRKPEKVPLKVPFLKKILQTPAGNAIKFFIKRNVSKQTYANLKKLILPLEENSNTELRLKNKKNVARDEKNYKAMGVNVAGYINAENGMGEAVRSTILSTNKAGIPYILNNFNKTQARQFDKTFSNFIKQNPWPINCIQINADGIELFYNHFGPSYFKEKYNIGYWLWELSVFPKKLARSFDYFNEIWTPSSFAQEAISSQSPTPVIKIPLSINIDETNLLTRSHFNLPEEKFIFLFIFDMLSVFERKNPLAVIKAFAEAFSSIDNVILVLKCINGKSDKINFNALFEKSCGLSVRIIDGYFSKKEVISLENVADAYVSLHRSEGFGLTMAEAMYLKKPIIATAYSGNMEFMNINNSFPVKYRLKEIEKTVGPYEKGNAWAEPDISHAAEIMRYVYEHPKERTIVGERAAADIRKQFSQETVGSAIKKRLERIAEFF